MTHSDGASALFMQSGPSERPENIASSYIHRIAARLCTKPVAAVLQELLAALTATVEDPAASHVAQKLGRSRQEFTDACMALLDELVRIC